MARSWIVGCVFAVAVGLAATSARSATAAWNADPVEVHSTSNACSQVAVCADGAYGAIVVWQEADPQAGSILRAARILATGNLDTSWPAGNTVNSTNALRSRLQVFPDGLGGALAVWMEGDAVYMTRITSDGAVPPSWPAHGRLMAQVYTSGSRPRVIADGTGGIYASWRSGLGLLRVLRIGNDGLASPGWPSAGRSFGVPGDDAGGLGVLACGSIARAPDDGLFVVRAGAVLRPDGTLGAGSVLLSRLGSTGAGVAGWSTRRISSYPMDELPCCIEPGFQWWVSPLMGLVDVVGDGSGGVYVLRPETRELDPASYPGWLVAKPRLHHLDSSAAVAPGWPAEGRDLGAHFTDSSGDLGSDASYRVLASPPGEITVGLGESALDSPQAFRLARFDQEGAFAAVRVGSLEGNELESAPNGDILFTDFVPHGPTGPWQDFAHVACTRWNGPGYGEHSIEIAQHWYGDNGATGLPDGGVIFCWSQERERFGVFAVRLNAAGLVTGVPQSAPRDAHLSLRFIAGVGVRALASFAGAGEARLVLADIAGRAVAREAFDAGAAPREWTLAGTAALSPGLYFARLTRGAERLSARVVVTR